MSQNIAVGGEVIVKEGSRARNVGKRIDVVVDVQGGKKDQVLARKKLLGRTNEQLLLAISALERGIQERKQTVACFVHMTPLGTNQTGGMDSVWLPAEIFRFGYGLGRMETAPLKLGRAFRVKLEICTL